MFTGFCSATTRAFLADWVEGKTTKGTQERYGHVAELFLTHLGSLADQSMGHSFNSHLANAGVDQKTRQIMTGQATKAANDDYTHLDLPKLTAAIVLLPDVDPATQPEAAAA